MVGRGEDADRSFEDYFEKRPEDGEVAKGANFLKAGQIDEAIEVFQAIIRANPNNVSALRFLAVAYFEQTQRKDDAEALLRRVREREREHREREKEIQRLLQGRSRVDRDW